LFTFWLIYLLLEYTDPFEAKGRRRRPNLALILWVVVVYFVMDVSLLMLPTPAV